MEQMKHLVEEVLEARGKVDRIEAELAHANKAKEEAEKKVLDVLETSDEKSRKIITMHGVKNVIRKEKLRVSINADDKEELLRWVDEDCGRSDMIKPSIHHSTLTSFIQQRIKDAQNVPAFISMYFQPFLTISKAK